MTLVLRSVKGSKLTISEMDNNLLYLQSLSGSTSISAAGTDGQIQFNQNGSFGANTGLTYDYDVSRLKILGSLSANNLVTGYVFSNPKTIDGVISIPDNNNAFLIGPNVTIAPGSDISLGINSDLTIFDPDDYLFVGNTSGNVINQIWVQNLYGTQNILLSGSVSANTYYGDGSNLSGIATEFTGNTSGNTIQDLFADGEIHANSFYGDGSNLTGVISETNFLTRTKGQIDTLINTDTLVPSQMYKITGVDIDLYGGTDILIQAETTNKLSIKGKGIFFNPKYDQTTPGYGIWNKYINASMTNQSGFFTQDEFLISDLGDVGIFKANGLLQYVSGTWTGSTQMTGQTSNTYCDVAVDEIPKYELGDTVIWGGKKWVNIFSGNPQVSGEIITIGDGGNSYEFSLTATSIVLSSITITDGTEIFISSDLSGNLTGDLGGNGQFNYSENSGFTNFNSAVASGTPITISYTIDVLGKNLDKYSLDDKWQSVQFNEVDYNLTVDEIEYDYEHDKIISRKDTFNNEVTSNYIIIENFQNENGLNYGNPIKDFQWGNAVQNYGFDISETQSFIGVFSNRIIDSYFDCLNFLGGFIIENEFTSRSFFINNTFSPNLSNGFNRNILKSESSVENNFISKYCQISGNQLSLNSNIINNLLGCEDQNDASNFLNNILNQSSSFDGNILINSDIISCNLDYFSYINDNRASSSYFENNYLILESEINSNLLIDSSFFWNKLTNNSELSVNTAITNSNIYENSISNSSNLNLNIVNSSSIYYLIINSESLITNNLLENTNFFNNLIENSSEFNVNNIYDSIFSFNRFVNSYFEFNQLSSSTISHNSVSYDSNFTNNIIDHTTIENNEILHKSNFELSTFSANSIVRFNRIENDCVLSNSLLYDTDFSNNLIHGSSYLNNLSSYTSYINLNSLRFDCQINNMFIDNSEIKNNHLSHVSSLENGSMDQSYLNSNFLNENSVISNFDLTSCQINFNELFKNTLNFTSTGSLNTKNLNYLNAKNCIIDQNLSGATIIYGDYPKNIIKNSASVARLTYYDAMDLLVIGNVTD